MAPGYGISSIGNYANDPYFMYAYNGYNLIYGRSTISAGSTGSF